MGVFMSMFVYPFVCAPAKREPVIWFLYSHLCTAVKSRMCADMREALPLGSACGRFVEFGSKCPAPPIFFHLDLILNQAGSLEQILYRRIKLFEFDESGDLRGAPMAVYISREEQRPAILFFSR